MSMNELLANYYGTNGGAREELEKQAQVELFAKLAAENGIDLEQLSEEQIQTLWDSTFKTASDEDKDDKDEKKEKAEAEFEQKKEAAAKLAEADFLGRVMAHAYVDELNKIASGDQEKEAGVVDSARRAGWAASSKARRGAEAVGKHLERVGKKVTDKAMGGTEGAVEKMNPRTAKAIGAGVYAGGTAAAGGAAYGAHKMLSKDKGKKKKASALDELAFEGAVEKAASAGFDAEEVAARVSAVITLGVEESAKIASADSLDGAVHIRSLELLEAAGYPVSWE